MKAWKSPAEEVKDLIRDEMEARGYRNIRINAPENMGIVDREALRAGHEVNGWTATVFGTFCGTRERKTATVHYDYAVHNARYFSIR